MTDVPWIDPAFEEYPGKRPSGIRHVRSRRPAVCPRCKSHKVARIQYGYPRFTNDLQRDLAAGRVVLGGCCLGVDEPDWVCLDCGEHVWRRQSGEK